MTGTTEHNIWDSMLQRCTNQNRKDYPRYGGRGITVCERWKAFENFLLDMGRRPAKHSLNRKDNNGPYSPDNCEWASVTEQARNTSVSRVIALGGDSMCLSAWAERLSMNPITLQARLRRGWNEKRALTEPVDKRFSHV